jgi:hypothetical protein
LRETLIRLLGLLTARPAPADVSPAPKPAVETVDAEAAAESSEGDAHGAQS